MEFSSHFIHSPKCRPSVAKATATNDSPSARDENKRAGLFYAVVLTGVRNDEFISVPLTEARDDWRNPQHSGERGDAGKMEISHQGEQPFARVKYLSVRWVMQTSRRSKTPVCTRSLFY